MTGEEVSAMIDDLKADRHRFQSSGFDTVGSGCAKQRLCGGGSDFYLYMLYMGDQHPYDVLSDVKNGVPYQYIDYWSSPTNTNRIYLFFDDHTKLLRGWVNDSWSYSSYKFWHERFTSKLKIQYDYRKRMSKDKVHA